MTKIYVVPGEIHAPDFEDYLVDNRYDHKLAVKLEDEFRTKLADWCRQHGGSPKYAGGILRIPAGDGYAEYMVWKLKPLSLIHLPLGDAWNASELQINGLTVKYVKEYVDSKPLFGEKTRY